MLIFNKQFKIHFLRSLSLTDNGDNLSNFSQPKLFFLFFHFLVIKFSDCVDEDKISFKMISRWIKRWFGVVLVPNEILWKKRRKRYRKCTPCIRSTLDNDCLLCVTVRIDSAQSVQTVSGTKSVIVGERHLYCMYYLFYHVCRGTYSKFIRDLLAPTHTSFFSLFPFEYLEQFLRCVHFVGRWLRCRTSEDKYCIIVHVHRYQSMTIPLLTLNDWYVICV